jgi:osmotically-inducible protein OsmY
MSHRSQFACRAVTFAACCICGGCSTAAPQRPEANGAQNPADVQAQAQVEAALANDPGLNGRVIEVWVESGVAHLRGVAQSTGDLKLARIDAMSVPNVVAVDERQLVLDPGGTPP